jgi:hypothetical protein
MVDYEDKWTMQESLSGQWRFSIREQVGESDPTALLYRKPDKGSLRENERASPPDEISIKMRDVLQLPQRQVELSGRGRPGLRLAQQLRVAAR